MLYVAAALREFPAIRYKAAKTADGAVAVGGAAAAVAAKVHRAMLTLNSKPGSFIPGNPSCDLLIVDRGGGCYELLNAFDPRGGFGIAKGF